MKITDQARELLKNMLKQHDAKNLRVYFAGFG